MTSKKSSAIRTAVTLSMALAVAMVPALARAKSEISPPPSATTSPGARVQPVQPLQLADVVVTNPPAPAPAAPPPAPPPQVVAPAVVAPAVVPAAPVEPAHRSQTTVVEHEHNYVGTIFVSTLLGGAAGALIGGALWYLNDNQTHSARIGYWAAGGVLVGAAVGVTQIIVQESRLDRATASLPSDPAPTFRLALWNRSF